MSTIYFIGQQALMFIIPLLIVALGGMFSEKSGIINIALEGIMIIGAFCGIMGVNAMQKNLFLASHPQFILFIAILISILSGMLFSSLLAYAAINMKSDQTIGGTALDLLAPALVIYIARTLNNVKQVYFSPTFMISEVPVLSKIPVIGDIFFKQTYITTYLGLMILILALLVLRQTKFGLRLSACGEHPQAAESVGVNVYKMRWAGVLISGALGGLGGLVYVIASSISFAGTVSGYGFLALAVMIFGQWKPMKIFFASIFFGFFMSLASTYINIGVLVSLHFPSEIYKIIPYVATMIALVFTSKKSRAPKAEGIPYDSGTR